MTPSVGLILLAAGSSTRLGRPKQLLPYRNRTLLRHAAETALASECHPIVVVLGAQAEQMQLELTGSEVQITENFDWEQGMGSSIRVGLTALETISPNLGGTVVMLCDQPLLTAEFLDSLVQSHRDTNCPLVVSEYADTRGVPAFFSRALFSELHALIGTQGAKQIIARHGSEMAALPFPAGTFDVDTESDYERLSAAQRFEEHLE
jgi:molybdenum cofactor cytidylyltransferase